MAYIRGRTQPVPTDVENKLLDGEIVVVVLPNRAAQEITDIHAQELSRCYIDPAILQQLADNNGITLAEQLAEFLPDRAHIRSGDFGEILCRQYLSETEGSPRFPVYRWRNRSNKNDTVRGTDLIGYLMARPDPSDDDILYICEVKTRASTVEPEIVQDAYRDMEKDFASRAANSLYFCQARLAQDGLAEEAQRLARYTNPHRRPYKKKLVAAVVHADALWQDAFLQVLPERHDLKADVEVLILRVEDLAEWIDQVYAAAPEIVGQDA